MPDAADRSRWRAVNWYVDVVEISEPVEVCVYSVCL
jgi:hypothetical protein